MGPVRFHPWNGILRRCDGAWRSCDNHFKDISEMLQDLFVDEEMLEVCDFYKNLLVW